LAVVVVLLALYLTAFVWVWIGLWSFAPGRYPDESTWRGFVLRRAEWSLVVGLPVAIISALVVLRLLARRKPPHAPDR